MLEATDIPDEYVFYYTILEADETGRTPEDPEFDFESSTTFHKALECRVGD